MPTSVLRYSQPENLKRYLHQKALEMTKLVDDMQHINKEERNSKYLVLYRLRMLPGPSGGRKTINDDGNLYFQG